jgi:hypothetical protein
MNNTGIENGNHRKASDSLILDRPSPAVERIRPVTNSLLPATGSEPAEIQLSETPNQGLCTLLILLFLPAFPVYSSAMHLCPVSGYPCD